MKALIVLGALAALVSACGGGGGSRPPPPPPPAPPPSAAPLLARVETLAAGDTCATGGVLVLSGSDDNRNGTLDSAEVAARHSACNGAAGGAGAEARARVIEEAAGATCAVGGQRIETGVDRNGNGALDAAEVQQHATLCRGSAGADAVARRVAVASVAPGALCAAGGSRVTAGADRNANGQLDADEIDSDQLACNATAGSAGAAGADAARSLVAVQSEPAGAACAQGGSRIAVGLDRDGDGVLASDETSASAVVCDGMPGASGAAGAPGPASLLRLASLAAGAQCSAGGTRVEGGIDANANSQLDNDEVASTRYLCNGLPGATGSDAAPRLVAVSAEPAGATCAAGGRRLASGLDTNRNGVLDPAEVAGTGFVCDGVPGASGSPGLNSLLRQDAAGSACPQGGREVASGLDANGNGQLDHAEVASVDRVCNGAAGSSGVGGAAGLSAQVAVTAEAAGANCTLGGSRIDTGIDSNRNGQLDSGEVAATRYLCAAAAGPGFGWAALASGSAVAAPNQGYLAQDESAAVTLTLPPSPLPGDVVRLSGSAAGGWALVPNSGQRIVTLRAGLDAVERVSVLAQSRAVAPASAWRGLAASADLRRIVGAVQSGTLQVSTNGGATWTSRDSSRAWVATAASADGSFMAAAATGDRLYTSNDAGQTWTARENPRNWRGIASSADGLKLAAVELGGQVHTSADGGLTWTPRDSVRQWWAVASAASGQRLVAVVNGGQIHVSADGGVNWTPHEQARTWVAVASSASGQRLVAADYGGFLYVSVDSGATWAPRGVQGGWSALSMSADGLRAVASDEDGQVWLSEDGGSSWALRPVGLVTISHGLLMSADGADVLLAPNNLAMRRSDARRRVQESGLGGAGAVRGGAGAAAEVQYLGQGEFLLRSHQGTLFVE